MHTLLKKNMQEWEDLDDDDKRRAGRKTLMENYTPIFRNNKSQFNRMTVENVRAHYQTYIKTPQV